MKKRSFLIVVLLLAVGCGKVNFNGGSSPSTVAMSVPIGPGEGGTQTPPSCTPTSSTATVLTSPPAGTTSSMLSGICPALGADKGCGAVIIITDTNVSVYYTGETAYDSNDDTLVGVLNQSSVLVGDIVLTSNVDIMGFDGDGMDTYPGMSPVGNSQDKTGYGGPNAYFTNISANKLSGTVNFINPISAKGGTTYFTLENSLNAASTCLSALTN